MKKKTKPTRAKPSWSAAELRWYHDDDNFSNAPWWVENRGDGVERSIIDRSHPELQVEGSKSRHHRPAPILWEVLRRHPEIPAMHKGLTEMLELLAEEEGAFIGAPLDRGSLRSAAWYHLPIPGAAISLATSYGKPWPELDTTTREDFERSFHQLYNTHPFSTGTVLCKNDTPYSCVDVFSEDFPLELRPQPFRSTSNTQVDTRFSAQSSMSPTWLSSDVLDLESWKFLGALELDLHLRGLGMALVAYDPSKAKKDISREFGNIVERKKALAEERGASVGRVLRTRIEDLDRVFDLDRLEEQASPGRLLSVFKGVRLFDEEVRKHYLEHDYQEECEEFMAYSKLRSKPSSDEVGRMLKQNQEISKGIPLERPD